MARVFTSGLEWNDFNSNSSGMDGGTGATGTNSIVTTPVRSGVYALKADSTGSNVASYIDFWHTTYVANTSYYMRVYLCFPNLPTTTAPVFSLVGGQLEARLTTAGKLQFWVASGTPVQVGSDSAATLVADGATWYRVELAYAFGASVTAFSSAELKLDGVTVYLANASELSSAFLQTSGWPRIGWGSAPGASKVMYADDIAVNDSTGAAQNSWAGDGKVVLLRPASLNTNGGSWTDDAAATTSAALATAIDNTPPLGIADTAAGGGNHQVRNAAALTSLDMNLSTYSAAGVGASDTINVVEPQVAVSAPAVTSAKSGSFGIASNPVIANRAFTGGSGTATLFWGGIAAGTYPQQWRWEKGTFTHAPTVTVGTAPVARLTITGGTAARIAMACAMGLMVDYTPAAAGGGTDHFDLRGGGYYPMERLKNFWLPKRRKLWLPPAPKPSWVVA